MHTARTQVYFTHTHSILTTTFATFQLSLAVGHNGQTQLDSVSFPSTANPNILSLQCPHCLFRPSFTQSPALETSTNISRNFEYAACELLLVKKNGL